jgi:hypothetical protein
VSPPLGDRELSCIIPFVAVVAEVGHLCSPPTPRILLEPNHCTPHATLPSLYRHVVYMLCNERNDKVQTCLHDHKYYGKDS